MRKTILALIILSPILLKAQNLPDSLKTTQEEYTWVTKSYTRVLTEAMDIKRGYIVKDINTSLEIKNSWGFRNKMTFAAFATETGKLKAVIAILRVDDKLKKVICIPINNPDLMQAYFSEIESLSTDQKSLFAYLLSSSFTTYVPKRIF